MNFNFPETPPPTPQAQEENYRRGIEQNWLGTSTPTPIRSPLPSRTSADNFSRLITGMTDEKKNTISITPKKTVLEQIGQRQLSEQLQGNFPDVDEAIKKESETFKKRS